MSVDMKCDAKKTVPILIRTNFMTKSLNKERNVKVSTVNFNVIRHRFLKFDNKQYQLRICTIRK